MGRMNMNDSGPVVLGLQRSFGFGDRLGLAGPGHVAVALANPGFAPVFAQQSIRELARTDREPEDVLHAARTAVEAGGWDRPWGADADHLKTPEDVRRTVAAGFTFFTFDPSEHVDNTADRMSESGLSAAVAKQADDGVYGEESVVDLYREQSYELDDRSVIRFDEESLLRAAVKYGRAVHHCAQLSHVLGDACSGRLYEIEVSVDETDTPTSPLEHLFFALELRRRGVVIASLAPRFVGDFEKGIDYKGDHADFERHLAEHIAIARTHGPYKISVHSGSDKFGIYPIIGRVCGDLLHVKTAGTSYLEALRVVLRVNPPLFAEIARYCVDRFETDRASYHISTSPEDIARLPAPADRGAEAAYLGSDAGRQLLHVTFGSVLTRGNTAQGRPFKEAILEALESHADLHKDVLTQHLGRHLEQLQAG